MASVTMEQMKELLASQTKSLESSIKEQMQALDEKYDGKIKLLQEQQNKDKKEIDGKLEALFKEFRDKEANGKRPCNSATRASSADAGRISTTGGTELKEEIREKLERRVTVGGFMGNSPKMERESKVNILLTSLGVMKNYGKYDVFAKGATGPEAVIQFESRERASQFIKDNIEELKKFKVAGRSGEERNTFFSLHMDEHQWKVYHATRLLTSSIIDSKKLEPMTVKGVKHKGIISINDFDIIKMKIGLDGNVEYKYIKQNIKDLGEEGFEAKLKPIVDAFAATFK